MKTFKMAPSILMFLASIMFTTTLRAELPYIREPAGNMKGQKDFLTFSAKLEKLGGTEKVSLETFKLLLDASELNDYFRDLARRNYYAKKNPINLASIWNGALWKNKSPVSIVEWAKDGKTLQVKFSSAEDAQIYSYPREEVAVGIERFGDFATGVRIAIPGAIYGIHRATVRQVFENGWALVIYDAKPGFMYPVDLTKARKIH